MRPDETKEWHVWTFFVVVLLAGVGVLALALECAP